MLRPAPKPTPKPRTRKPLQRHKPMPQVSAKRKAYRASEAAQEGSAYMLVVKQLPCCICAAAPSEAHHCKCKPLAGDKWIYEREPVPGRKSGDGDTIPLCASCHRTGPLAYHAGPASWRERNGRDYTYILATRQAVADMEDAHLGEWL